MLKHFVITRLGLAVYGERRLNDIIDLFEMVTLPSLLRQSCQDFIALIIVDADMPEAARGRIEQLLLPYPSFNLVAIDLTGLTQVRQGCFDWIWDRCQDVVLEAGLIEDPDQYIITSVIDADDAWHRDVVQTVNAFMAERLPRACDGDKDRGTWLQHTCGIAATFARGYKWFIAADAWEAFEQPFMSMAVFVAARFSSGISACSSRHLAWPAYCNVLAFEAAAIEQAEPMWLWVRHNRTTQPWDASALASVDGATSIARCRAFGIDLDKLQRWRSRFAATEAASPSFVHAGRSASDQYDRIFKIAGLNRQIAALWRRRRTFTATPVEVRSLDAVIAQKEAQRTALVEVLRARGIDD